MVVRKDLGHVYLRRPLFFGFRVRRRGLALGLGIEELDVAHAIKYKGINSVTEIKPMNRGGNKREEKRGSPAFLLLVGDEELQLQLGVLFVPDYAL